MLWTIIGTILMGGLAGWVAGKIMKTNLSLLWTIILGILGGVVGSFLASLIGISGGWIFGLLIAIAGACLLIWLAGKLKK